MDANAHVLICVVVCWMCAAARRGRGRTSAWAWPMQLLGHHEVCCHLVNLRMPQRNASCEMRWRKVQVCKWKVLQSITRMLRLSASISVLQQQQQQQRRRRYGSRVCLWRLGSSTSARSIACCTRERG